MTAQPAPVAQASPRARAVRVAAPVLDAVIVLAKDPQPGRVKTRLSPTFTPAEAAALAKAAIRDTLDAAAEARPRHTVIAWDGPPEPWLTRRATVLPQRGSSLDERLEHAFADVLEGARDRLTVLVGMDTPQIRGTDLAGDWAGADAVLGLCEDGGYWAIGFRRFHPGCIRGVAMSTDHTGRDQLARLRALGLRVHLLPIRPDVDRPRDAATVAGLAPDSRFGRLHRRLVAQPCAPSTLFDAALAGADVTVDDELDSARSGRRIDVHAWQWMRPADELLASRCAGPVLDIGCGPGRFVEALATRGIPALGVDICRGAVERTSRRGGCVLLRDINDRLPGEGRWGTVLLADGNIGIGGDPFALLHRCRQLLRDGGTALVEADPDDRAQRTTWLTLRGPHGRHSSPVPWARVGALPLIRTAAAVGFLAVEEWRLDGRVFVALRHAG